MSILSLFFWLFLFASCLCFCGCVVGAGGHMVTEVLEGEAPVDLCDHPSSSGWLAHQSPHLAPSHEVRRSSWKEMV